MDRRKQRIAENEVRFRDINERLRAGVEGLTAPEERIDYICECGDAACASSLALTVADYELVRGDPLQFAVEPGHEVPDVESVVARYERYLLVRKHAESAPLVATRDLRR